MRNCMKPLLLLSLVTPISLMAHEGHDTPVQTVAGFHEALASGDQQAVLGLLDPEVIIFESGGAELSRDEYASHHLGADMEFSGATRRKIVEQTKGEAGDAGWVLTRSETRGTFRGGRDSWGRDRPPSAWRRRLANRPHPLVVAFPILVALNRMVESLDGLPGRALVTGRRGAAPID